MGCDIHSSCEVRNKKTNKWEIQGEIFPNPYYDKGMGEYAGKEFTSDPVYNRNYNLFSILADVRNGYGFAGIKTGEGFVPISLPKGVPEDASDEYKARVEDYGSDGHSHSWITVKELEDYDWGQVTMHRGCISLAQYKELRGTNDSPDSWSGDIIGPEIVIIDEDEADLFLDGNDIGKTPSHINYHWSSPYKDSAEWFLEKILPILKSLGEPEDVRMVFFFDN